MHFKVLYWSLFLLATLCFITPPFAFGGVFYNELCASFNSISIKIWLFIYATSWIGISAFISIPLYKLIFDRAKESFGPGEITLVVISSVFALFQFCWAIIGWLLSEMMFNCPPDLYRIVLAYSIISSVIWGLVIFFGITMSIFLSACYITGSR